MLLFSAVSLAQHLSPCSSVCRDTSLWAALSSACKVPYSQRKESTISWLRATPILSRIRASDTSISLRTLATTASSHADRSDAKAAIEGKVGKDDVYPNARSINLSHPSCSMIEPGLTNQRFSLRCCDMSLRFCPGVRVKSLASSRKICTLTQPTLIHPTYITGTSALRRAMIARRCHRSNAARYCDCHCGCIAADQKVNRSQLDEAPPAPPGFSPGWQ